VASRKSGLWMTLAAGESLERQGVPRSESGRFDLRGIEFPQPRYRTRDRGVKSAKDIIEVRNVEWRDLDLSGANLSELRLFDVGIFNCIFDSATCRRWRTWGIEGSGCSFRDTDLRGSALGAPSSGRRSRYVEVDFAATDFRQTFHHSAQIIRCTFDQARLKSIDDRLPRNRVHRLRLCGAARGRRVQPVPRPRRPEQRECDAVRRFSSCEIQCCPVRRPRHA